MKAINILGIILSIAVFIVCFHYSEETRQARWASWDYYYPDVSNSAYYGPSPDQVTREGGLVAMAFTLFFVMSNISNLMRVKTITTKVLSIIGLSLTGIVFIVNLLMIVMAHDMHFDESTGAMWLLLSPVMLAFSIVFFVQTVLKKSGPSTNQNTLDDIIRDDIV